MDAGFFLKGLITGFSIAAPVGPIGVLCIRRSLTRGWLHGFITGLGAATADAAYGCVAGFGMTIISGFLINHSIWLNLTGGVFLCYLGLTTFQSGPAKEAAPAAGNGLISEYASTFLLTLTNPMTILLFAAVFTGLGIAGAKGNYADATVLVIGVFTGSASWWLILTGFTSLFRTRLNLQSLKRVNRISGLIILTFGLAALLKIA